MTHALEFAIAAAFGAVVGSFLNVVIWRLPRGESVVRPRSRCISCGEAIRPRDNVPIAGWLLLRGRCRSCGARIPVRYPLVEALTAGLFLLGLWRFGLSWEMASFWYLSAVGVALAYIDIDTHRLPDRLTLPSYAVAAALLGVAAVTRHRPERMLLALLGMAVMYGFFFLLMVIKPNGMGFGDVKLSGVLGLYLGYLGLGILFVGAFLAFLLGGLAAVGALVRRRATRHSTIAFGPALVAGALAAALFGGAIVHAYTGMLA